MDKLMVCASEESISSVLEFVDDVLLKNNISQSVRNKVEIAVDEIISNIVRCAYPDEAGSVAIEITFDKADRVILRFIDSGIPYNPLENEPPDTSLPLDERPIGGLGIHMVRSIMEEISYEYTDGQNILTIIKNTY